MDGWQKLTDVLSSDEREKCLKVGGGGRGHARFAFVVGMHFLNRGS